MEDMVVKKKQTVLEHVIKVVAEQLIIKESDIAPDDDIVHDMGADSMDVVEIPMYLEEDFDIDISSDEFDKATRVGALADLVQRKLDEKHEGKK
jgi:acyl carrier protein